MGRDFNAHFEMPDFRPLRSRRPIFRLLPRNLTSDPSKSPSPNPSVARFPSFVIAFSTVFDAHRVGSKPMSVIRSFPELVVEARC